MTGLFLGSFLTSLRWTSILASGATHKPGTMKAENLLVSTCPTILGEAFFTQQKFPEHLLCGRCHSRHWRYGSEQHTHRPWPSLSTMLPPHPQPLSLVVLPTLQCVLELQVWSESWSVCLSLSLEEVASKLLTLQRPGYAKQTFPGRWAPWFPCNESHIDAVSRCAWEIPIKSPTGIREHQTLHGIISQHIPMFLMVPHTLH